MLKFLQMKRVSEEFQCKYIKAFCPDKTTQTFVFCLYSTLHFSVILMFTG